MRLDLLLLRESFEANFAQTLSYFLSSKLGWKGSITWEQGGAKFLARKYMRVNHKLNLIYPVDISRDNIQSFADEYAFHPNLYKRLAQTLYTKWAIRFPFDRFFSIATIEITPWPDCLDSWCIIPGNHSLRIVDFSNDQCYVVLKQGFNKEFIEREISIRNKYPELPVPRLKCVNDDGFWYSEERISALPLNRVSEVNRREAALAEAKDAMKYLYEKTTGNVSIIFWAKRLQQKINESLTCLPEVYREKTKKMLEHVSEKLVSFICEIKNYDIEVALSHGDFQPANILVPKLKADKFIYLIDWEYADKRVKIFDDFVFELESRFPVGLADRIESLFEKNKTNCNILAADAWKPREIALCLLEEILVRIKENQIPGMKGESRGLNEFILEVRNVSWPID